MKVLGLAVRECDTVLQKYFVFEGSDGKWLDYFTIKDEADAREAERLNQRDDHRIVACRGGIVL